MRGFGLVVMFALAGTAAAAEIRAIAFDRDVDRYVFESEVYFAAELEALYGVFLNYDLSTQFSAAIAEARNLPPDSAGRPGFYVQNRGCVLFFCIEFERHGYVEHEPYTEIRAAIDAEKSDFHFSNETWVFRAEGAGTTVNYRVEFEPKFWVPPVIGPWAIRRSLSEHGGSAVARIEAIARDYTP